MSERYVVSLRAPFASDWGKSVHGDLPAAVLVAWRRHGREWSVGDITKGQKAVIGGDELAQAIARLNELRREQPRQPAREAAEQVVRELAGIIKEERQAGNE